jgi:hypothetical protein
MKNKKLVIVDNNIEYTITDNVSDSIVKTKVKRADNDIWADSARGETCLTAVDDGNSIKINMEGEKIELDYAQAFELLILLTYINNSQPYPSQFQISNTK